MSKRTDPLFRKKTSRCRGEDADNNNTIAQPTERPYFSAFESNSLTSGSRDTSIGFCPAFHRQQAIQQVPKRVRGLEREDTIVQEISH
jgi:hypothetical protein